MKSNLDRLAHDPSRYPQCLFAEEMAKPQMGPRLSQERVTELGWKVCDAVVVGGGPAGCGLAYGLHMAGLKVEWFDRNNEDERWGTFRQARHANAGINFSPEVFYPQCAITQEHYRALGVPKSNQGILYLAKTEKEIQLLRKIDGFRELNTKEQCVFDGSIGEHISVFLDEKGFRTSPQTTMALLHQDCSEKGIPPSFNSHVNVLGRIDYEVDTKVSSHFKVEVEQDGNKQIYLTPCLAPAAGPGMKQLLEGMIDVKNTEVLGVMRRFGPYEKDEIPQHTILGAESLLYSREHPSEMAVTYDVNVESKGFHHLYSFTEYVEGEGYFFNLGGPRIVVEDGFSLGAGVEVGSDFESKINHAMDETLVFLNRFLKKPIRKEDQCAQWYGVMSFCCAGDEQGFEGLASHGFMTGFGDGVLSAKVALEKMAYTRLRRSIIF